MNSFKNKYLWIVLVCVAGLMPAIAPGAPAGIIIFAIGDAQIIGAGGPARNAEKNIVVNEGDTLVTGKNGAMHVRMNDTGFISVRPDTRLAVQSFIWNGKEDGLERSVLSLLRGGFRTITGVIGRRTRENYLVNTPTATIGIRGTDHEPHYIAPDEVALGEPGTYNKVNVGATFIRNASGTVELGPNEAGFASATPGKPPVRLSALPGFMRNAPVPLGRPDRAGALDNEGEGGTRKQAFAAKLADWAEGDQERKQFARALLRYAVTVSGSGLDLNVPAKEAFTPAPPGTAVVGGFTGPRVQENGGLVVTAANNNLILLGPNNNPLFIGVPGDGFRYSRDVAPLVDAGQTRINGTGVNWGIYAGGSLFVDGNARTPQFFYFMGTGNVTAVADLALPGTAGFNTVAGFTRPINEAGQLGGDVRLQVSVVFGANPRVTAYNLGVQDALGRNWLAALNTPSQALANFAPGGGGGNNLNVQCSPCGGTGTGKAVGYIIGGANRDGFISSFGLNAGTASVTGAVVVK
jgi:FecR protein